MVGALVILVVVAAVAAAIGLPLIAAAQKQADIEQVEQVVLDFDSAYEKQDCDLLQQLITADALDDMYGDDGFDCDVFEDDAAAFVDDDGDYTYEVDISSTSVTGDKAKVTSDESWERDGAAYSTEVTYRLEREGGGWVITDYKADEPESDDGAQAEESDEPEESSAGSDEDQDYKADLISAKTALIAYSIEQGGYIANFEDLQEYGLDLGPRSDYLTLLSKVSSFCFETTSQLTGTTYSITDTDSVVATGCDERDF